MTIRFLADENFDGRIVRGLFRLLPSLDLVRVQDSPQAQASDDAVLGWAARERRVVLMHDVGTMTAAAWARVRSGQSMPGLLEVPSQLAVGRAIKDIPLLAVLLLPERVRGPSTVFAVVGRELVAWLAGAYLLTYSASIPA